MRRYVTFSFVLLTLSFLPGCATSKSARITSQNPSDFTVVLEVRNHHFVKGHKIELFTYIYRELAPRSERSSNVMSSPVKIARGTILEIISEDSVLAQLDRRVEIRASIRVKVLNKHD